MHEKLAEKVIPVFIRLAEEASEVILEVYQTAFDVALKADRSPVTEADIRANQLIVEGLHKAFPGIPVLAEESPDDLQRLGQPFVFLVDPLDGTREFVKRNGEFTVNIALLAHDRPAAGVIKCPVTGQIYLAAAEMGAWVMYGGDRHRIQVSDRTSDIRLLVSRSQKSRMTEELIAINHVCHVDYLGSSLKGCRIAAGDAEAYYRFGRIMEWDTAAMEIIVEEAGGVVRAMDGSPLRYNKVVPDHPDGLYIINHAASRLILPSL